MRQPLFVLFLIGSLFLLGGCGTRTAEPPAAVPAPTTEAPPPPAASPAAEAPAAPPSQQPDPAPAQEPAEAYHNEIFQHVTVTKIKADTYEVKGQAKVFEAVVNYVVEDGHNELVKGHVQASQGAPAWGDFSFTLHVKKERPNSTLMLILFETSAKDGRRHLEMPIPLPD
ncbi:sporulation protein [Brevibacillus sp. SYP-B805]|uniref:Gmad2 immunoglobulin-like domain-containing protein n=1 Tax=Brevibacillus sp. SYP-B805 TaxID=1578199 RepID=UPI0013EDDEDB|nr:Gmad2 immunoglobulin-like domain-containing protein [Brevibacillus sp. SYP-B805]NGQ96419.1 sporulation protein [Brevibacillus sp. SYP-B805]